MDPTTTQKLRDFITTSQSIGIAVGKNPSIDEMGAALALYLSFTTLQKKVSIASPTEAIVELSSLVGIDRVRNKLDASGADLVVSFPYRESEEGESEIQKVSYTIENGYLNIVVKAGNNGLSFSDKDVRYSRGGGGAPSVVFIIGTPRLSDLGSLFDVNELKDTKIVNIDNKTDNQNFGDVVLVSPRFSSVCEQVASIIKALDLPLDVDIAQNLLSGISHATSNFQKSNTSYMAFEMAAFLMQKGARRGRPSRGDYRPSQRQQEESGVNPFLPPSAPTPRSNQQQAQATGNQQQKQRDEKNPPADWLMPKVYKGSTTL